MPPAGGVTSDGCYPGYTEDSGAALGAVIQ